MHKLVHKRYNRKQMKSNAETLWDALENYYFLMRKLKNLPIVYRGKDTLNKNLD